MLAAVVVVVVVVGSSVVVVVGASVVVAVGVVVEGSAVVGLGLHKSSLTSASLRQELGLRAERKILKLRVFDALHRLLGDGDEGGRGRLGGNCLPGGSARKSLH